MPIYFTLLSRLSDQLLLCSTFDDDDRVSQMKSEARRFAQNFNSDSMIRSTFKLHNYSIHICHNKIVIAICAADHETDPVLVYEFLDTVIMNFMQQNGSFVQQATKEYQFLEFHQTIENLRVQYSKRVADSRLSMVQSELSSVQQNLMNNVKSALIANEKLGEVSEASEKLQRSARMFADDSAYLNRLHLWRTYGRPAVVISIVVLVYYLVSLII